MSPGLSGRRLAATLGSWLLGAAGIAGATVLAARAMAPELASDPSPLTPVLVAEVYLALIAALVVVLRPRFREVVALRRPSPGQVGLAVLAVAAAYAAVGGLQGLLAPRSWSDALAILLAIGGDDGRLAGAGPGVAGVILVRACGLAAFGEELLFRGALYSWLRGRWSAPVAIAVSAAAFTLIHGFPAIFPLAFAMGLGFGWVRERTGSIVPSLIVHAAHNAALVAVSYWLTGWTTRLPTWDG